MDADATIEVRTRVRTTRSQELVDAIIGLIDRHELRAGDPLPTESRLMAEFEAARNSVREALRTLQAFGIVEVRHGYGIFVGDANMAALSPSLLFRTRARSRGLNDLLAVRQILETELAKKVTSDHALLADLAECVEQMADPATASAADRRFHERICEAAGNELALELIGLFSDVLRQTESPAAQPHSLAYSHSKIVDAISSCDRDAIGKAVGEHFDEIRRRIATN
jgi:DNA-binding FadR family transcriptional regulator